MLRDTVVITLIGPDKVGIVQSIAQTITQHQASWLKSSMANLGGQFAGILQIEVDQDKRADLLADLNSIAQSSLTVQIATPAQGTEPIGHQVTMELVGDDHIGIINNITQALTDLDISIETLESSTQSAPMSGGTLFRATASLNIPKDLAIAKIEDVLHKQSISLMVDITLSEH